MKRDLLKKCATIAFGLLLLSCTTIVAQTTVVLNGQTYTLRPHPRVWLDGPTGTLTTSLSNSAQNGKGSPNNPPYAALTNSVDNFIAKGYTSPNADYGLGSDDYTHFAQAALRWQADGDPKSLAAAKYGLQNIVNMVGGSTYCNTGGQYCNGAYTGILNFKELYIVSVAQAYSIVRNQLTPAQRASIANQVLNDNDALHNGIDTVQCTNNNEPWKPGDCGIVWLYKHDNAAPPLNPAEVASYNADYPNGNSYTFPAENLTFTALCADLAVGLAFADDDPRAVKLLQWTYNYYIANAYAYARQSWTGFNQSGALYANWRTHWFSSLMAIMVKNSVVSGPDLTGGLYITRQLPYMYYNALPDSPGSGLTFEDIYGSAWDQFGMRSLWMPLWLYSGTPEASYANYYARVTRGDFDANDLAYNQGAYLPWSFTFTDPQQASTPLSNAPTQYLFRATDYNLCASLGLACVPNSGYTHAITRTGWNTSDSLILLQSSYNDQSDHSGTGDWGSVHIYRKGYLLAGDAQYANNNRSQDDCIELGNGDNWVKEGDPAYANIVRWAGADPTGDSQSRYAYALTDMTGAYAANMKATRVQRSVIHFKKSGIQDYLVWYDDVATSAGTTMKAYMHFYLNGIAPSAAINFQGGNSGGTVTNTQSGARLLTTVLPTAGANTARLGADSSTGSYSGGGGYTYRTYVCAENAAAPGSCNASSTQGEWIVVHKPTTTLSDTMPALTQPPAANFRVVQINDATSPKVAVFAVSGNTYASVSFTTTHAGTAQYVIAGLTAGTYNVTLNGSPIATNQSVADGDNTLYFESGSGNIGVTSGSHVALNKCDVNADGSVNSADVSLMTSVALGNPAACTPAFDINQDGVCNVVDVQRVIDAALGLGCRTTP